MDNFALDKCSICGEYKALKNGIRYDCEKNNDMPNFLKKLFNKEE